MLVILRLLCVLLLGALILVPFVQVIMRDVFGAAIVGAEELTRFLLICTVFVAYPLVVRADENIAMSELRAALPGPVQRGLGLAITLLSLAAAALIAGVTAFNISDNLRNATPTLGIPFWIFLGACLLGFAGAALCHALQLRAPPPPPGHGTPPAEPVVLDPVLAEDRSASPSASPSAPARGPGARG